MGTEQIVLLLAGVLSIVLGLTGVVTKTRKGQRWSKIIGETGVKLVNIIGGIVLIVVSFFV